MHPAMQHLAALPVAERLEIVQQLWDSIAESQAQLPIHDWQREVVRARLADVTGGESGAWLTRDELWQRVEQRREA